LTNKTFNTPEEAEIAFYEAIERSDIDVLREVWSTDDNIVCIHPGADRIEGRQAVLDSFTELFMESPMLSFSLMDTLQTGDDHLAIHLVREHVEMGGQFMSSVVSTNIYQFEDGSWRMLLHHASPEPDAMLEEDIDEFEEFEALLETPPVLH
jgi:ketosteroid isomerase-like protein